MKRRNLTAVKDAYVECAIFADCPEDSKDQCTGPSPEFEQTAYRDIKDFMDVLERAGVSSDEWNDEEFGRDFWFTRQGHGTGFWDRGKVMGAALTKWAKMYGTKYVYVGDDGLLYSD